VITRRSVGIKPRASVAPAWIPVSWIVLLFVSSFRYSGFRDPGLAAAGVASPENALELAVYGVVGILAVTQWLGDRGRVHSLGIWLFIIFGTVAVTSSLWSTVPLFSIVRGGQVLVLALLVSVTARIWATRPEGAQEDWRRIWVAFIWLAVAFSVIGLLWQSWLGGRFTWPGLHPGTTAEYLGIGAVVALSMMIQRGWNISLRLRRLLPFIAIGMATLMFLTVTRSVMLAFLVAVPVTIIWSTFRRLDLRILATAWLVLTLVAAVVIWPTELFDFVLRGGTVDQLSTLTGRTELWAYAFETVGDSPIVGFGYGAGRLVLTERFPWSGTGHNLWVEASVSLGLVGALLVSAILVWIGIRAVRAQRSSPSPIGNVGLAVGTFVLVAGVAGVGFALPGFSQVVIALVVAGLSSSPGTSPARGGES